MDELAKSGGVDFIEFFLPGSMPEFCTGCQLCFSGPPERCPHAYYTAPVLAAVLKSDALVFASPHYGACDMPGAMKNLLDHLDFLTFTVTPRAEIFNKKAFIITTGAGSAAVIKMIRKFLINWGVNRVYALGLRLFTDKWDKLPDKKSLHFNKKLRRAARRFYGAGKKYPYISAVMMYHVNKFVIKKYVGAGNYPYEYWKGRGYFDRRPF